VKKKLNKPYPETPNRSRTSKKENKSGCHNEGQMDKNPFNFSIVLVSLLVLLLFEKLSAPKKGKRSIPERKDECHNNSQKDAPFASFSLAPCV